MNHNSSNKANCLPKFYHLVRNKCHAVNLLIKLSNVYKRIVIPSSEMFDHWGEILVILEIVLNSVISSLYWFGSVSFRYFLLISVCERIGNRGGRYCCNTVWMKHNSLKVLKIHLLELAMVSLGKTIYYWPIYWSIHFFKKTDALLLRSEKAETAVLIEMRFCIRFLQSFHSLYATQCAHSSRCRYALFFNFSNNVVDSIYTWISTTIQYYPSSIRFWKELNDCH